MPIGMNDLERQLVPLQQRMASHPLIGHLTTLLAVRCFMAHHVFAVWDFVCLLKTLYARIGCVGVPWFPPKNAESVYFLSTILLDEESDQLPHQAQRLCHFDLYVQAMIGCGANTGPMQQFLLQLGQGQSIHQALQSTDIPVAARQFVQSTWTFFDQPTPALAAAFVLGREAMVPPLFAPLLQQIQNHCIPHCDLFCTYLSRHITMDSREHYPQAVKMLESLCGDSAEDWQLAGQAAEQALRQRLQFLTGIQAALALEAD
jgi:hypothetical protein